MTESISTTGEKAPPVDPDQAWPERNQMTRRLALGAVAGLAATHAGLALSAPSDRRRPAPFNHEGPSPTETVVVPETFGAIGDAVTDDTAALQAAFDTRRSIRLASGKTYLIKSRLTLAADGISLTGGGKIKIARDFNLAADRDANGTHMRAILVTGARVAINGVNFDATDAPVGSAVENGFIWSNAPFTAVRSCTFVGNARGTCVWSLGDAPYLSVTECQFLRCSGAVFAKGRNPVIANNTIIDATDAAIAINGISCVGAIISNNAISNEALHVIPSMIAVEEGAAEWTISGNTLVGVNGGGIVCTNVLDRTAVPGGIISDNVISARRFDGVLPRSKQPAALLSISPGYTDWIVHDNRILGCPLGNSNSRLAIVPATGGIFHHNIVDSSGTLGLSAVISISPGKDGLTLKDNITTAEKGGRHFLFGGGEYEKPCVFIGGTLWNGSEGINSDFNSANISGMALHIRNITDSTAVLLMRAGKAIGDRADFLNRGAWARPHHIGAFTEMYCDKEPVNPGNLPFRSGDRFHSLVPRQGSFLSFVRVDSDWQGFGRL